MYKNTENEINTPRIIRFKEIIRISGLSRSTIYRRIETGEFPKSISLGGRCRGWLSTEVVAWITSLSRK